MNESSTTSDRPLYLYVAFLGNLIAAAGMAFLLLGILGALGLISAVTDSLGGFGSSFASATTGSAAAYSFAFLASLLSLSASWKMLREGPRLWLLVLVVVFQVAAAAVFHSWVSVIALIPTVAALYGLVLVLRSAPVLRGPAPTPAVMPRQTPAPAAPISAAAAGNESPWVAPAPIIPAPITPTTPEPATPAPVTPAAIDSVPVAETLVIPDEGAAPATDGRAPVAAQPVSSRRCADCGATNNQDARFCYSCGSILPG